MDLLQTILLYLSMVFVASVQSTPAPEHVPAYDLPTPTPYVETAPAATETPEPTPSHTPVPTIDITPNPDYKTIRTGDNGDLVRALQEKLAEYGYYAGDIDGRFGNQTRRAVEAFQYQHGLSVDGIAGRRTLTVLYESDQVRMAPSAEETPAPTAESVLSVAMTAPPAAEPTPAQTAQPTQTPEPTPTPTPTATPTYTPPPVFQPMEGYTIRLQTGKEPIVSEPKDEDAQPVTLAPYTFGSEIYLPLMDILREAGVNAITSTTVEMDEFAFAMGNSILRFAYTETQEGAPTGLEAYINNTPQIMPNRDIQRVEGTLYLPLSSLQSLSGITAEVDEAAKQVVVTVPEEKQE